MKLPARLAACAILALMPLSPARAQDNTGAPEAGEIYVENVAPQPLTVSG